MRVARRVAWVSPPSRRLAPNTKRPTGSLGGRSSACVLLRVRNETSRLQESGRRLSFSPPRKRLCQPCRLDGSLVSRLAPPGGASDLAERICRSGARSRRGFARRPAALDLKVAQTTGSRPGAGEQTESQPHEVRQWASLEGVPVMRQSLRASRPGPARRLCGPAR